MKNYVDLIQFRSIMTMQNVLSTKSYGNQWLSSCILELKIRLAQDSLIISPILLEYTLSSNPSYLTLRISSQEK